MARPTRGHSRATHVLRYPPAGAVLDVAHLGPPGPFLPWDPGGQLFHPAPPPGGIFTAPGGGSGVNPGGPIRWWRRLFTAPGPVGVNPGGLPRPVPVGPVGIGGTWTPLQPLGPGFGTAPGPVGVNPGGLPRPVIGTAPGPPGFNPGGPIRVAGGSHLTPVGG